VDGMTIQQSSSRYGYLFCLGLADCPFHEPPGASLVDLRRIRLLLRDNG
jgi:hypothetical protein